MSGETPIEAGGERYDRSKSLQLRETVIELRDAALNGGHMEWAVALSHVVAWMAQAIDDRWPNRGDT